jgi:hypothetical protein
MRSARYLSVVLVVVALAAVTAWAGEVVHFRNGTFLEIRSHEVKDGMVRVTLGTDAVMAFPVSLVERIENNGKEVYPAAPRPSANKAVAARDDGAVSIDDAPPPGPPAPRRSTGGGRPAERTAAPEGNPSKEYVGLSEGGMAQPLQRVDENKDPGVGRPFPNSPSRRKLTVVGDRSLVEQQGHKVVMLPNGAVAEGRRPAPMTLRPVATSVPAPQGDSSGGDSGSSGDSASSDSGAAPASGDTSGSSDASAGGDSGSDSGSDSSSSDGSQN